MQQDYLKEMREELKKAKNLGEIGWVSRTPEIEAMKILLKQVERVKK